MNECITVNPPFEDAFIKKGFIIKDFLANFVKIH